MNLSENNPISITSLAEELREHAQRCAANIDLADDRSEHIRMTQIALEASRLSLLLDRFISQNSEVGTGPVKTLPLPPGF